MNKKFLLAICMFLIAHVLYNLNHLHGVLYYVGLALNVVSLVIMIIVLIENRKKNKKKAGEGN